MPDGTLATSSGDAHVYGLDPGSGAVMWKWHLPTTSLPSVTIDPQGRLLCSCDGDVHMAEPAGRFEAEARKMMADAQATDPAQDAGVAPRTPACVQVEEDWIVVGSVRRPEAKHVKRVLCPPDHGPVSSALGLFPVP